MTALHEAAQQRPQNCGTGYCSCIECFFDKPAQQQEPVATDWERIARVQDAKLRAICNEPGGFEKLCEVMDRYERTSPQPSKPWVGLTGEDLWDLWNAHTEQPFPEWFVDFKRAYQVIEAKLKEKNHG